jgi:outer membrane protein assembly factor BamB
MKNDENENHSPGSTAESSSRVAQTGYRTAFGVALVAGIFSIATGILLAANYMRTTAAPPLSSPSMQQLITQLRDKPGNETLRAEIRAFDMLARKAYFTGVWFTRIGALLLLAGIITTLIALKVMSVMRREFPDPRTYPPADTEEDSATAARWFVTGTAIVLLVIAVVMATLFRNELTAEAGVRKPEVRDQKTNVVAKPAAPTVNPAKDAEMRKNWPFFRGYNSLGVAQHTNVPVSWDGKSGKNILWKTPILKRGVSSPIVWGNRIFITASDTKAQEVECFDADTGKVLWQTAAKDIPGSPSNLPPVNAETGYAASTPATDGERIFAVFATGDLMCLDFNGSKKWALNLGVPDNRYGHSSSLIVYDGLLLVQYDQTKGGRILALDVLTGKTVWEVARKLDASWSSPVLANTGNRTEVIIVANPWIVSFDPMNGNELWKLECMGGDVAPSAAYADGMLFAANESVRSIAIKISDPGKLAWEGHDGLPNSASPVATSQYLFMATSGGTITCFDAKNGALLWKHENEEGFYSSPIVVDGHVYLTDRAGVTHIVKADKEYSAVGSCELGDKIDSTPAFMNGRIYIRSQTNLFCIAEK